MWQSKQSCHWWDCNAQGACTSMPMLVPRAQPSEQLRIKNGTLAGPETCRQHEELSPANNFDMLPCCRFRNVAPRASRRCVLSHQESGTPRGTLSKLLIINAVTSRQVQLDRICTHTRKRAGGSLWHCTPHSRQLLQSVFVCLILPLEVFSRFCN